MNQVEQIKLWARELRAISQTGFEYGRDEFDKERYSQLLGVSNEMLSQISNFSSAEVNSLLPVESGYATPKVAVRGLVIRDGKVLMVQEIADDCWSLQGGWCDIGLSPSENIQKEIGEESGLNTNVTRLLCVFDQAKYNKSITMQHIYVHYFLCEIESGELRNSIETKSVDFFNVDELPKLSTERVTKHQLKKAFSMAKTEDIYFD